jgi:hypothetical protein
MKRTPITASTAQPCRWFDNTTKTLVGGAERKDQGVCKVEKVFGFSNGCAALPAAICTGILICHQGDNDRDGLLGPSTIANIHGAKSAGYPARPGNA